MKNNISIETANIVADIIEQIQVAHRNAGGVDYPQSYWRELKLSEILYHLVQNKVTFRIKYDDYIEKE